MEAPDLRVPRIGERRVRLPRKRRRPRLDPCRTDDDAHCSHPTGSPGLTPNQTRPRGSRNQLHNLRLPFRSRDAIFCSRPRRRRQLRCLPCRRAAQPQIPAQARRQCHLFTLPRRHHRKGVSTRRRETGRLRRLPQPAWLIHEVSPHFRVDRAILSQVPSRLIGGSRKVETRPVRVRRMHRLPPAARS